MPKNSPEKLREFFKEFLIDEDCSGIEVSENGAPKAISQGFMSEDAFRIRGLMEPGFWASVVVLLIGISLLRSFFPTRKTNGRKGCEGGRADG